MVFKSIRPRTPKQRGRPKKEHRLESLSTRVSPKVKRKIENLAQKEHKKKSDVVRELISKSLDIRIAIIILFAATLFLLKETYFPGKIPIMSSLGGLVIILSLLFYFFFRK
mgnify:CR=1 FL=1